LDQTIADRTSPLYRNRRVDELHKENPIGVLVEYSTTGEIYPCPKDARIEEYISGQLG
jgi:ABC-type phosphate transport system ATPase subunit